MAKEGFVAEVADRAITLLRQKGPAAVFVAVPPGLMAPLRDRLAASVDVSGTIGKDLTKVPDAELGGWLEDARYASAPPG